MKQIEQKDDWLTSWKESYPYDLIEVYNSLKHDGASRRGYAYAYATRRKHTLQLINRVASPQSKILDVAAAQGNFSLVLAESGYDVTWNDLREDLIDYVKLKHERGKIKFAPGNVFEIDFKEQFDLVLVTEIIEHVAHPDEFLAKISNLVIPGGYIVMTTPNGGYFLNNLPKFSECADPTQFESVQFKPNSDGHIFLLHLDELQMLAVSAGLTIIQMQLFTNFITTGHVKMEYVLKCLPRKLVETLEYVTQYMPLPLQKKMNSGMAVLFQKPQTELP